MKWDYYRWGPTSTRNLHDWTLRFPASSRAVAELGASDAIIDGEAFVVDQKACRAFPVFSGLLAAAGDVRTMLAGFDLLEIDGEGLRDRPLVDRRKALVNLLRRRQTASF
ncbi:hypothetical protein NKH55_07840 [Mesorhizobium opportunistum]|uniref:ATP-dependent DNA ligase n=1 Tax=Mesorhizobium TaxID=68287 RepID=UPI0003CF27D5|nr:hypothetical protein [Mesorhizobium sp. LNHC229A00]ESY92893.1 hypothetical protein X741_18080 [Mesorhizobium sp. LNHC229A00]